MENQKSIVRISVILTTYNAEKTIRRTLNSVFAQNGINRDFELELIVIDDCSTDQTPDILQEYGIDFYQTPANSGGPNKGRNIGLEKTTGDFICIMDHDDEWLPDRIITLLSVSHLAPVVSSGHIVVFGESNRKVDRHNTTYDGSGVIFYKKNETFLKTLSRSSGGQCSYIGSVLFNSSLKYLRFEENFGKMDYDWGLKLFEGNCSVEICRALYYRYVDDSNLSLNLEYRDLDFYYSLMTLEHYSDMYPRQVRQGYKRLHGTRARYFYLTGNMKKARFFFVRAGWNIKNILYYLTTFAGSRLVKKYFTIFG